PPSPPLRGRGVRGGPTRSGEGADLTLLLRGRGGEHLPLALSPGLASFIGPSVALGSATQCPVRAAGLPPNPVFLQEGRRAVSPGSGRRRARPGRRPSAAGPSAARCPAPRPPLPRTGGAGPGRVLPGS